MNNTHPGDTGDVNVRLDVHNGHSKANIINVNVTPNNGHVGDENLELVWDKNLPEQVAGGRDRNSVVSISEPVIRIERD